MRQDSKFKLDVSLLTHKHTLKNKKSFEGDRVMTIRNSILDRSPLQTSVQAISSRVFNIFGIMRPAQWLQPLQKAASWNFTSEHYRTQIIREVVSRQPKSPRIASMHSMSSMRGEINILRYTEEKRMSGAVAASRCLCKLFMELSQVHTQSVCTLHVLRVSYHFTCLVL